MSQPSQSSFFFLFLLLCPILHIIASLLYLFCSSNILLHVLHQIFFSAPSFPKYAKFSHHLPLNTVLLNHTAPPATLGLMYWYNLAGQFHNRTLQYAEKKVSECTVRPPTLCSTVATVRINLFYVQELCILPTKCMRFVKSSSLILP